MKKFTDLDFKTHPNFAGGVVARMNFDNGYGISVINGHGSYTDGSSYNYEVAVLYQNSLTYNTPITDDVIGYCSVEKVEDLMKQIQEL